MIRLSALSLYSSLVNLVKPEYFNFVQINQLAYNRVANQVIFRLFVLKIVVSLTPKSKRSNPSQIGIRY